MSERKKKDWKDLFDRALRDEMMVLAIMGDHTALRVALETGPIRQSPLFEAAVSSDSVFHRTEREVLDTPYGRDPLIAQLFETIRRLSKEEGAPIPDNELVLRSGQKVADYYRDRETVVGEKKGYLR